MKAQAMKAQPSAITRHPALRPGSPVLKVLMVYEDLPTGNRVMRIFDSLQHRLGKEILFQSDMWKFDILSSPSMGRIAAQDAEEADLILVSVHGGDALPDEVKAWFHQWIKHRRKHGGALAALLGDGHCDLGPSHEIRAFLEQMARAGRLEFSATVFNDEDVDLPLKRQASNEDEPPPALEWFCREHARLPTSRGRPLNERHH